MIYEIWSEGYSATGDSSSAIHHGQAEGASFQEACENFAWVHPLFSKYFNKERMTYWGCGLFNEEKVARKTFG